MSLESSNAALQFEQDFCLDQDGVPAKNKTWYEMAIPAYDQTGQPNFIDQNGEIKEGIYLGLPNDVYHQIDALSSSKFKVFLDTPAKYHRMYLSDISRKRTLAQKRTFDAGLLGHELVLEPEHVHERYFRDIVPSDYPNALTTAEQLKDKLESLNLKKTGKKMELAKRLSDYDSSIEIFDILRLQNYEKQGQPTSIKIDGEDVTIYGGKIPVDGVVWDDAHRFRDTVRGHREANLHLKNGLPEVTFIARDPITGLLLKAKFDWLKFDNWAVDLKSTQSTHPEKFKYQIMDLKYDAQQEFYKLVAKLLGVEIQKFIFVAAEYINADICQPYELPEWMVLKAKNEVNSGLSQFKKCLDTDRWYGWSEQDCTIVLD